MELFISESLKAFIMSATCALLGLFQLWNPVFLFFLSQPNRGTKRPRDDEEEELKMRRRQAGPRDRGRYREEEMAVVEETDDDKKRLLQIIDREGEEEEEEVRWQARLALTRSVCRVSF